MAAPTLLLSHDPARRDTLAAMLRAAGCEVLPFEAVEAAAGALATAAPATLVVDLTHPALDRAALQRGLAPTRLPEPETLAAVERRHIVETLAHTGGNRRQAALLLGISRSTLHNKIRRYDLGPR